MPNHTKDEDVTISIPSTTPSTTNAPNQSIIPSAVPAIRSRKIEYPSEKPKQREAFEAYYRLGDEKRSLKLLAETNEYSIQTLSAWSKKFKWVERVKALNDEAANNLNYESIEDTMDMRRNILTLNRKLVEGMLEKDTEGKVVGVKGLKVKSVSDLHSVLELSDKILHPEKYDPRNSGGGDRGTGGVNVQVIIEGK